MFILKLTNHGCDSFSIKLKLPIKYNLDFLEAYSEMSNFNTMINGENLTKMWDWIPLMIFFSIKLNNS